MIELVIYNRNASGEPTNKVHRTFNTGAQAADWYDKQRGHSINKEFDEFHKKISVVNLNKSIRAKKDE